MQRMKENQETQAPKKLKLWKIHKATKLYVLYNIITPNKTLKKPKTNRILIFPDSALHQHGYWPPLRSTSLFPPTDGIQPVHLRIVDLQHKAIIPTSRNSLVLAVSGLRSNTVMSATPQKIAANRCRGWGYPHPSSFNWPQKNS